MVTFHYSRGNVHNSFFLVLGLGIVLKGLPLADNFGAFFWCCFYIVSTVVLGFCFCSPFFSQSGTPVFGCAWPVVLSEVATALACAALRFGFGSWGSETWATRRSTCPTAWGLGPCLRRRKRRSFQWETRQYLRTLRLAKCAEGAVGGGGGEHQVQNPTAPPKGGKYRKLQLVKGKPSDPCQIRPVFLASWHW